MRIDERKQAITYKTSFVQSALAKTQRLSDKLAKHWKVLYNYPCEFQLAVLNIVSTVHYEQWTSYNLPKAALVRPTCIWVSATMTVAEFADNIIDVPVLLLLLFFKITYYLAQDCLIDLGFE